MSKQKKSYISGLISKSCEIGKRLSSGSVGVFVDELGRIATMLFFAGLGGSLVHAFIPDSSLLFTYQKSFIAIAWTTFVFSIYLLCIYFENKTASIDKQVEKQKDRAKQIPDFIFVLICLSDAFFARQNFIMCLICYAFVQYIMSCSLDALAKLPKYITRAAQGIIILLEYFYGSLVFSKSFAGAETYWSMIALNIFLCTRDVLKQAGVLVIELLKNISQGVRSLFNINVNISALFSKKHNCSTVKPVKKSNTYLGSSLLNMRQFAFACWFKHEPSENTSQPQCKPTV